MLAHDAVFVVAKVGGAQPQGAAFFVVPQDDAPSDYPVVTLPETQALAEARRRIGRLLGRDVDAALDEVSGRVHPDGQP